MNALVSYPLMVLAGLLAIPTAVLCIEIVAALVLPQPQPNSRVRNGARRRLAVLVPAHNESTGLLPTLVDIRGQLLPDDRLVVIADNCTDDTAAVARSEGAEVIERQDLTKLGKGYALDHGLKYLTLDPPEIVIAIDADCRVKEGTIDELAVTSWSTGQPTQSFNTMTSPKTSQVNHQVAEFAWQVKQWLRPLGLRAFSFPCQMTGTGMAFPWDAIRSVKLNSASLAEDLKLGLELSLTGYSPIFCPSACVTSEFPTSLKGVTTQRKRWEQGHIEIITNDAPRLFWLALARRNWRLLVLTLDLIVPPLSLLAMSLAGMFAINSLAALIGFSSVPFIISAASLFALIAVIVAAWLNCGRHLLPARAIVSVVPFVLGKIGLYRRIVSGAGDAKWDRTDRKR